MMKRIILALTALLALSCPVWAFWGIWYPTRPVGQRILPPFPDEQPADPNDGGQVVWIDVVAPGDPNSPITYDPAKRAVIVDPEWLAIAEQDRSRLAAQVATALQALDAVDSDVATLAATPDGSLSTIAQLRTVIRGLGRDLGRLSAIDRREIRYLAHQAGASVPAEP